MHHFNFNGEDSRTFGVYILSKTVFNKPARSVSFISVPGRDGDIIADSGGNYSNLQLSLKLRMFAKSITQNKENDFEFAYQQVMWWLSQSANYARYSDSYEPNYYRLACIMSGIKAEQIRDDVMDFEIVMSCKPYKYCFAGDKKITLLSGGKIYNPENYASKPYMKITPSDGTTDFSIAVNGGVYSFYQADGYVEIDSEEMNVFKGTVNKNNDYAATSFPTFISGKNNIAFLGNITQIEIIPRWRSI